MLHAKSLKVTLSDTPYVFHNYTYSQGMSNGQMAAGMCGAPLVRIPDHNAEGGGGVLGFFHLAAADNTLATTEDIDQLIDDGWTMVQ
jgi:hypothetical protein